MIDELSVTEYERARPLFQGIDYHRPAVFTVLEGRGDVLQGRGGRVFVDRRDRPTAALILFDCCYLAGSASNTAFNAALCDLLHAEAMPKNEHLLLYTFTHGWREALDDLLKEDGVKRVVRTSFDLDANLFHERHHDWRTQVPKGYAVRRMDADLATQAGGLVELWGSIESFLAGGFGFCVLHDDADELHPKVVSSCQTVFVADEHAETGVSTQEPYRRRGLATLAGCAYLEHCIASGIRPEWQCFYNAASENLAQKLGFTNKRGVEVTYVRVAEDKRLPR